MHASEDPSARPFPGGRPKGLKAPHGATLLELAWSDRTAPDGTRTHSIPHRILRGYCPCAGCQGHSGEIRFHAGGNLEIRELEPVGNYALTLRWGDQHDTGIYTFELLWKLGELVRTLGPEGVEQLGVLPRA
jgi:DUF971 family protein